MIHPHSLVISLRKFETESFHTTLIFVDCGGTVLLGIFSIAEEHALVSSGLFIFADTAGLQNDSVNND
jgi:hypothetical protein